MIETDLKRCFSALARCKKASICPNLPLRHLFFEPNPKTMSHWRQKHGFYLGGIDPRVVFVCESPSDRRPDGAEGQSSDRSSSFEIVGVPGWVCWDYTSQDRRFREVRKRYGFENCLVTNAVKCGPRGNLRPGGPTDEEAEACSQFLRSEIEAVHPVALACMGSRALDIVLKHALPTLSYSPAIVPITHYSFRGPTETLRKKWDAELARLKLTLKSRGA